MNDPIFTLNQEEIYRTCDRIIKNTLDNYNYSKKSALKLTNTISEDIIRSLYDQPREGYKFICMCNLVQKGDISLFSSSSAKWNKKKDFSLKISFENEEVQCFVCLYAISPKEN